MESSRGIHARQSAGSRFDPVVDRKAKEPVVETSIALRRAFPCTTKWCSRRGWDGWLGCHCQSRVSHAAHCDDHDIQHATTRLAESTDSSRGRLLFKPQRVVQVHGVE